MTLHVSRSGAEIIFSAMAETGMPALTEIQAETCNIRPEACTYVAAALKACTALTSVTLSSNPLAPMGMKALAEVLKFEDCKVTDLKLGWVKLGSGQSRGAGSTYRGAAGSTHGVCCDA